MQPYEVTCSLAPAHVLRLSRASLGDAQLYVFTCEHIGNAVSGTSARVVLAADVLPPYYARLLVLYPTAV